MNNDWQCPYCKKIAFNGGNKLRHLAKHEPVIARMLRDNFRLQLREVMGLNLEANTN